MTATVQEGLYDRQRAWRTFGMALDMLLLAGGALFVVAAFLPNAALGLRGREEGLVVGVALLLVGVVTLRLLVLRGRKVGAVYGVKAAQRAGLMPPEKDDRKP